MVEVTSSRLVKKANCNNSANNPLTLFANERFHDIMILSTPRRIIMKSILEELFYGNICPNTDCRSDNEQTKQLIGYIADHHSILNEAPILLLS